MRRFIMIAALICLTSMARFAAAAEPGIVLYSSLGYAPAVALAFTQATGIVVRVVMAPGAAILAHITEQGQHPRWSLAWFNNATSAVMLDHAGLLAHGLPVPSDLTKLGMAMTSPSGAYVPTGLTMAGILVAAADPHITLPTRWLALAGPAYHGIIGMDDPELHRETYAVLAALLQEDGGWPQGKSFITNLKQDGLHIYAGDADTLAALRSGSIGLAIINAAVALDYAKTRDTSLRLEFPKPVYATPSVIVMARSLSRTQLAAARRFIAFVNQPAIQRLRMRAGGSAGWYWPVTKQPAPHHGLPPLASLDFRILDARYWGALEPEIIAWFNKTIAGPGN